MSKHTPGPWITDGKFAWAGNQMVAHASRFGDNPDEQQCANACLIAAAPDLLTALEYLLPELQCRCNVAFTSRGKHEPNTLCHHTDDVKAAIAKARDITKEKVAGMRRIRESDYNVRAHIAELLRAGLTGSVIRRRVGCSNTTITAVRKQLREQQKGNA